MSEQLLSKGTQTARSSRFSISRLLGQVLPFVRTLDGASLILIGACIAAARLVPGLIESERVSDAVVALISAPLLVVLPRQAGVIARPFLDTWREELGGIEDYIVTWLTGMVLLVMALVLVTEVARVPATPAAVAVLLGITVAGILAGVRETSGSRRRKERVGSTGRWWPLVAALGLAAVPLAVIRAMQPYPLLVGWGMFNMNFRVLEFLEADKIPLLPGIHTPVHAALVGISSTGTGAESMGVIWAGPILLYLSFGVGLFALTKRLIGDDLLALVAVWIGVWLLSFQAMQHLHAFGLRAIILAIYPWILIVLHGQVGKLSRGTFGVEREVFVPFLAMAGVALIRWFFPGFLQVWLLLALFAALLFFVRRLPGETRSAVVVLTLVAVSLTMMHFIEGPLFFGLGLAFVLLLRKDMESWQWRIIAAGAFGLTVLFIASRATGIVSFGDESAITRFLLGSDRADATDIPLERKLYLLRAGLSYPIIAILALASVRNLLKPTSTSMAALMVISLATFVYFLPESGMHRLIGPVIPLFGLVVVLEIVWWARMILSLNWLAKVPLGASTLAVVAGIALTPAIVSSLSTQLALPAKAGLPYPDLDRDFANITNGEFAASQWIDEHIPQSWAVVSDPITMFFMEGLTFNPQVAIKRAWVSESEYAEEDRLRLRSLEPEVFNAATVDEALDKVESLTAAHPGYVLLISQRTIDWILAPDQLFRRAKPRGQSILDPEGLRSICSYYELEPCPERFFSSPLLSEIYRQDGVVVLVPTDKLVTGRRN